MVRRRRNYADLTLAEKADERLYRRVRYLPVGLYRARVKLARIEAEIRFLGMDDLLADPRYASDAFEREFAAAKAGNTEGTE